MRKRIRKLFAAAMSAVLGAAAIGGSGLSLPAAADEAPKLMMSLLAGGSDLGIVFQLQNANGQPAAGYSLLNGNKELTLDPDTASVTLIARNAQSMDEEMIEID